jgi:CheY-like chemotaxis protein
VQVVPELGGDLLPAMVDPSQVEAAILNLCLNARDAMPDGGKVRISTMNVLRETDAASPPTLPPGRYVRICVSDTGVGMTADVKARAFEPFFTTKGPAGSGLGLSQVYGMASQSGGDVTIDSRLGEGTQVALFLPAAMQSERVETPPLTPSARRGALAELSNELVMVVDDDNEVRQVTVEMTRDLGCQVVQAVGGEQALALIDTIVRGPTLILLDYSMPGMNGLQLARALRDRGVTAPIALVTGYAELSETDIEAGQLAGLLHKPFTIQELSHFLLRLRGMAAEQAAEACLETASASAPGD